MISILDRDIITYHYSRPRYDVLLSLLVICCMKRSEFEAMLQPMRSAVKPGGIIVVSSRNYLDPELKDYYSTSGKMIEPNTYRKKDACCKIAYFIEKDRLRKMFSDIDILYYYEGYVPCKYDKDIMHGESHIICRKMK